MLKANLYLLFVFLACGILAVNPFPPRYELSAINRVSSSISCGPNFSYNIDSTSNGRFISPMPGWGNHHYDISSTRDSAGYYFDQGLTMYYSYHNKEAIASFKEAARFDDHAAILFWGQALAMGPTYNGAHLYKTPTTVIEALRGMNQRLEGASSRERDLVAVMNSRYDTSNLTGNRKLQNEAWSSGLNNLIRKYPDDNELKALYVDAIMLEHAWDFWYPNGRPKEWTPQLISLCKEVLEKQPDHPAILHYYIHITEASRDPGVALFAADKLKDLVPGVAHMVHMSSHEYERNGRFADGVEVNDHADAALLNYDSLAGNLQLSKHAAHYFAVQAYCGLSGGMYEKGLLAANKCRAEVLPSHDRVYQQYLYMFPELTMVRLGKWDAIVTDTSRIDSSWTYARLLSSFAKGLAFVRNRDLKSARMELMKMNTLISDPVLKIRNIPFNTPFEGANIASSILNSSILFASKKYNAAIDAIQSGITIEDSMIYSEPREWMLPARQYLGYYLIKMGELPEAEKIYREDLVANPGNGWSLAGLYNALQLQKKFHEAKEIKQLYEKAFAGAEKVPEYSCY